MVDRIPLFVLFGLATLLGLSLRAAEPATFDPLPGKQREAYRFNLKQFYATEEAWKADLGRAAENAVAIAAARGKVLESPQSLLALLVKFRDQEDLLLKLYGYGEFHEAIDTRNRKYIEAYEAARAASDAQTSFVRVEIQKLSPATLAEWLEKEPGLRPYRYTLEDILRETPHTLSAEAESLLAALRPDLGGWQAPFFQLAFDRTAFPEAGGRNVYQNYESLLKDPDRAVREQAFRKYYAGLKSISDLTGFALLCEMRTLNAEAKLRGFETRFHQALFENYLTRKEADALFGQIEAEAPLYRDYQKWRRGRIAARLGLETAEIWDYEMPCGEHPQPRFTADEGMKMARAALAALGPAYQAEADALLDPASGRLDIAGGPNRRQGAFCEGDFAFFMDGYQGYLGEIGTVVHEAGHAIHHGLVRKKTGSLYFSYGPIFMTESFAMFNEWLLRDYLLRTSKDAALQATVREEGLHEMMYLWELARRTQFEMASYDRVASGEISSPAGFQKTCLEVGKRYDTFFGSYPELEVHFMRKHHYWSVPTYYHNYVIGHVLALKYYEMYRKDPKGFAKKYVAMVEGGFDRPAAALLKDHLGIDLSDPALLRGTFDLLRKELQAVQAETK